MTRQNRMRRCLARGVAALAVVVAGLGPLGGAGAQQPDVRIGWTAWADAEVVSKMTYFMLGRLGLDAELTLADVSAQYQALANDDLDLMLMSWQPETHAQYLERYGDRLEDLGPLYEGADVGLAVPTYVDESIQTVGDLAEHTERFNGRIEGIGATAGVMRLTEEAMTTYGLEDFDLRASSGPAMAKRLGEAVAEERPVVVTAWRPHWKWAEYDLRYLDDPEGIYDSRESVHAMAREGFSEANPRVARMIERMRFELGEVEALMAAAREKGQRQAIRDWLNNHSDRVAGWIEGE